MNVALKRKVLTVNDDRESKWPAIVFFVTSGLFFFGCVWYLYAGTVNPEYYWQTPPGQRMNQTESCLKKNNRFLLKKNQAVRVDDARLVYRGTQNGMFVMDLFVLALEPHYGYVHRIDQKQAHQGFSIGEYHFQALVASDEKISLKRLF